MIERAGVGNLGGWQREAKSLCETLFSGSDARQQRQLLRRSDGSKLYALGLPHPSPYRRDMSRTHETHPLGQLVPGWTPPAAPDGQTMDGVYCALNALDAESHAALLFRAFEGQDQVWDYLPYGPFSSAAQYHRWVRETVSNPAHLFYAIKNKASGDWEGVASYLRIDPAAGSIEVGNINFSPALQGSRAATEAMYLMMTWVFEAGYRRYEWKCNALNKRSRSAAQRLGFGFEGVFRHAAVVKGRNRDTAWFSVIDSEWPALREAFEAWLSPQNFDEQGRQVERLGDLTGLVRQAADPTL